jgi:hypothetical protein
MCFDYCVPLARTINQLTHDFTLTPSILMKLDRSSGKLDSYPVVALPLVLHDDFASHLRMHPAVKRVFPRLSKTELELIVRVHCGRLELSLRTVNGVGDVVVVDPGHLRTGLHRDHPGVNAKLSIITSVAEPPVDAFGEAASPEAPPGCKAEDAATPLSVITDTIATSAKALQVKSTDCPVLIFLILPSRRFLSPEITGFLVFYSLGANSGARSSFKANLD